MYARLSVIVMFVLLNAIQLCATTVEWSKGGKLGLIDTAYLYTGKARGFRFLTYLDSKTHESLNLTNPDTGKITRSQWAKIIKLRRVIIVIPDTLVVFGSATEQRSGGQALINECRMDTDCAARLKRINSRKRLTPAASPKKSEVKTEPITVKAEQKSQEKKSTTTTAQTQTTPAQNNPPSDELKSLRAQNADLTYQNTLLKWILIPIAIISFPFTVFTLVKVRKAIIPTAQKFWYQKIQKNKDRGYISGQPLSDVGQEFLEHVMKGSERYFRWRDVFDVEEIKDPKGEPVTFLVWAPSVEYPVVPQFEPQLRSAEQRFLASRRDCSLLNPLISHEAISKKTSQGVVTGTKFYLRRDTRR